MSQLLEAISGYLDDSNVSRISEAIGADPDQTQKAISAALPTLLGAVTRNASDRTGQENLHNALVRDHDGSILDHLGSLFGSGSAPATEPGLTEKTTSGGAILDHILGSRKERVEKGVSNASGLNTGQAMKLMAMLAPLLMGALGKFRKKEDLSAGGLGDWLKTEKEEVEEKTFGGGMIGRMLDQDGDGDFDMMDLVKIGLGRFFKK